jgi:drug/metabolite transporter (DMT)-like permease
MLSTQPIMAPIMAWLLLREQVTKYNILGILISTMGMLLLLLTGGQHFGIGNPWGILLAILTVSCSVGYSVVLRRIPEQYSPLTIVFYVQTISLVLFYLLWGGNLLLSSSTPELLNTSTPELLNSIFAVLYLAVLASVTAFILFCYTVRYIGVTRANIFNNIRPVFTALLMLFIFHEQLPIWKWIGIIVIIIGLFVCQKRRKV